MSTLKELEVLILVLISKHHSINDTYSLTRFFAKSSILPDKLYATLKDLVAKEFVNIKEIKNTINYYELTAKGKAVLDGFEVFEYLEPFALQIDNTAFISKIIFLLDHKDRLVEVFDSYLLSDGKMIVSLISNGDKLPDLTTLENFQKKKWRIRHYLKVLGSINTYETIEQQENQRIFQYLIEGLNNPEKPEKEEKLRILERSDNLAIKGL